MSEAGKSIGVDFEEMFAMMAAFGRKIGSATTGGKRQWNGFAPDDDWPTTSEISKSEGTAESVTYDFRQEVRLTALTLSGAMSKIQSELAVSHDKIVAAVTELAKRDETLADEAALILEMLDAVPDAVATTATKTADTSSTTSFS